MPYIEPDPDIARTEVINHAIQAEYSRLRKVNPMLTQQQALDAACRNVAARRHQAEIYRQERAEVERDGREPLWS